MSNTAEVEADITASKFVHGCDFITYRGQIETLLNIDSLQLLLETDIKNVHLSDIALNILHF